MLISITQNDRPNGLWVDYSPFLINRLLFFSAPWPSTITPRRLFSIVQTTYRFALFKHGNLRPSVYPVFRSGYCYLSLIFFQVFVLFFTIFSDPTVSSGFLYTHVILSFECPRRFHSSTKTIVYRKIDRNLEKQPSHDR